MLPFLSGIYPTVKPRHHSHPAGGVTGNQPVGVSHRKSCRMERARAGAADSAAGRGRGTIPSPLPGRNDLSDASPLADAHRLISTCPAGSDENRP